MASTGIYPQAVVIPILSLVSLLIGIVPLFLHAKNRNYPAACLISWFCILNLFNIINAFIWPGDNIETWWSGEGLCDVEVKLMTASYVAVPGTLVCIFRSLACVLDTRSATVVPSKEQRWRSRFMLILFCAVVPVIAMITNIVYQARRYYLFGIAGCVNDYDQSFMSFLLAWIWPLVICLIAAWYCGLVLYRLHKYRNEFGIILSSASSRMNKSRFLRLFVLAFLMLLGILPVQIFIVYYNCVLVGPWHPYSWAGAHASNWYDIPKVPSNGNVFFDRWIPIVGNFMIFVFFGCGKDATKMYRLVLFKLGFSRCFPRLTKPPLTSTTQSSHTPNAGESFGSKAKLLLHRGTPFTSKTTLQPYDCELGPHSSSRIRCPGGAWFRFPWFRSKQSLVADGEALVSLPRFSGPSNTVCTTAWAGTSQSRGSCDLTPTTLPSPEGQEFIRVKQEISQQSEMQG